LAQNRKFYFRVKKALFLYALPARLTDRNTEHSTLKTEYQARQSTPERYSRAVEDNVPEHGPAGSGEAKNLWVRTTG